MRNLVSTLLLSALVYTSVLGASACDNPSKQLAMNECAAEGHAKADKALNRLYANYKERLSASQVQQLKAFKTLSSCEEGDLSCPAPK